MDSNLTTYNTRNKQKDRKPIFRFKSDRLVFLICILIAAVFWLLIKLSAVYTVDNSFQLSYTNESSDLRVTKLVDSTLDLNLTARGFSILKMNLFNDMKNLDINLDNYTVEPKGNSVYAIYTQELRKRLARIIGGSEKNIQFSKAVLTFEMEKLSEKLIKVVPNYSFQFTSQYDIYNNVICTPDYIKIYGPQSMLDTINDVYTNNLIRDNVMSDFVVTVGLENPNPDLLRISVTEVSLDFKVEKFTESEIMVAIAHDNLKYKIKTFPSKVKVFYQIAQIDFNKVHSNQFSVLPITNNLDLKEINKLPLKLSKQPNFVRNARIVPSTVEFLIIK
jgi:hypothetical protein